MPGPLVVPLIGMAVSGITGGILAANKNSKIKGAISDIETDIANLERDRTKPPDLSNFVSDTSAMITNPYANLGVATKAMKIQAEQTDAALANTLDTLRISGKGSGGATALAMAALKSKQGIAADIEKQEMTNQKLRADGEQKMNEMKRQEAIRMQSAEMDAAKFKYTETRDNELLALDRQQGLLEREWQQQAAVESGVASGIGGMMSAFGSLAGMG